MAIVTGTWTIPGTNIKIPDLGYTEYLRSLVGKLPSAEVTTRFNNPLVIQDWQKRVYEHMPQTEAEALRTGTDVNVLRERGLLRPSATNTQTTDTGGKITERQALEQGLDVNRLRQEGKLAENRPTNSGAMTEEEALQRGIDVNELRKKGLLIEKQSFENPYDAQVRKEIESAYNQIFASLDQQAGLYDIWEQKNLAELQKARDVLAQGIQQQRQTAQEKLGTYKSDIEARKRLGMEEVSQKLRNLLKATGMQLGAMGAGSSSAAQLIAPYALTKQAARATSQIVAQANEQLAELDRKMLDVQSVYDNQMTEIDKWLQEKKMETMNTYNQMRAAIQEAKRTATAERATALANLDKSLADAMRQRMSFFENVAIQNKMAIDNWARERMAQLDNFKLQLAQSANFNPRELTYQELVGLTNLPVYEENPIVNPYVWLRRKEEKQT